MSIKFDDPDMQEIFESFLVETQELLDDISNDLMLLEVEEEAEKIELIQRIFRCFHTIKGTASFMGFTDITNVTHHAEDLLNKLRHAEIELNQEIVEILLDIQELIQIILNGIKSGEQVKPDIEIFINRIIAILENSSFSSRESSSESNIKTSAQQTKINAFEQVMNDVAQLMEGDDFTDEQLELIDAAFNEVNQAFKAHSPQPDVLNNENIHEFDDNFTKSTGDTNTENSSDTSKKLNTQNTTPVVGNKVQSDTIRIDLSRLESLMDLSGELVLGRNRLTQLTKNIVEKLKDKDIIRSLIETSATVDFVTSEIQSAVMRMRMIPIEKLFQKAPRIVRNLAKEFNKKINIIVEGTETEIDRGIIEELNDPLVHMLRNSCDHGIENPEERLKKGKAETGTITLSALQEGNNIVITIKDDGAGINPEKIKVKAIEKNLITELQASQMSLREALQLIFAPGFSTASIVSEVSGRGVGMDVVRTNIQNLKGMIEIISEIDKGTTFIIKLPLTLAIIQGLLVKVNNEVFALPLSSVLEVVSINSEKISTVNGQEVIRIRDSVHPILNLDKALGLGNNNTKYKNRNVVTIGYGINKIGLVVDELLGQQEIVIKSLGSYLGNITGISGSSILGDGKVVMILDIAELVDSIYSKK